MLVCFLCQRRWESELLMTFCKLIFAGCCISLCLQYSTFWPWSVYKWIFIFISSAWHLLNFMRLLVFLNSTTLSFIIASNVVWISSYDLILQFHWYIVHSVAHPILVFSLALFVCCIPYYMCLQICLLVGHSLFSYVLTAISSLTKFTFNCCAYFS